MKKLMSSKYLAKYPLKDAEMAKMQMLWSSRSYSGVLKLTY